MAYCVFRFRHGSGQHAAYEPENKRLEWWLTVVTAVGVAAMLAPGLFVWHQFVTVPDGRDRGRGRRPAMAVELPAPREGRPARHVRRPQRQRRKSAWASTPSDANGKDDIVIEGDELHLPIGKPVKVLLRSVDVLHNFYVPEFRAKMDMVPGSVTYFWLTPTRTGTFEILCAELVRRRAPQHARRRRGGRAGGLPGLAGEAADLRGAVRRAQDR